MPVHDAYRYDDINVAVESNLRKQAEVMHGIDANMQAFGDILQQNASSQQVNPDPANKTLVLVFLMSKSLSPFQVLSKPCFSWQNPCFRGKTRVLLSNFWSCQ